MIARVRVASSGAGSTLKSPGSPCGGPCSTPARPGLGDVGRTAHQLDALVGTVAALDSQQPHAGRFQAIGRPPSRPASNCRFPKCQAVSQVVHGQSNAKSSAGAECVSAPTLIRSTPVAAAPVLVSCDRLPVFHRRRPPARSADSARGFQRARREPDRGELRRSAKGGGFHIIQQHDIGPAGECVGQLFERIDLDFDWDRRLQLPAGGGHGVGNRVAGRPRRWPLSLQAAR